MALEDRINVGGCGTISSLWIEARLQCLDDFVILGWIHRAAQFGFARCIALDRRCVCFRRIRGIRMPAGEEFIENQSRGEDV